MDNTSVEKALSQIESSKCSTRTESTCTQGEPRKLTTFVITNSTITNSLLGSDSVHIEHYENMPQQTMKLEKPTSVDNVKQPTPSFIQTADYIEAECKVKNAAAVILHVHGFPGTGKSEIVRRLASKFPFSEATVTVKWHIECHDGSQNVDQELGGILKHLKENQFVINGSRGVTEELSKGRAKPFVNLLKSLRVPVLIVIEDPKPSDFAILRDLLTTVDDVHNETGNNPFHIYITSRKNAVAMPNSDLQAGLQCYKGHKVDGFSDNEGLQLLFSSNSDISEAERKAALRIIGLNSGSPLGLIAVKANCRRSRISYEEYLEMAQDGEMETEVQELESSQLQEEYGDNFRHLFRSVVLLLKPKEEEDRIYQDIWQVMTTLCFLHHGEVPRQLVGKIAQGLTNKADNDVKSTSQRNTVLSGNVISHLEDYGICKVDGSGYTQTTVSFHEVIFRAVRVMLKMDRGHETYINKLQCALFALSAIVHKDLRKSVDNEFMNKLAPQIQIGLEHAQEQFKVENEDKITTENFLLRMCICHLSEVIGIVKSLGVLSTKQYSENCLEFAATVVLKTVAGLVGTNLDSSILQPSTEQMADEVAVRIVEKCVEAGNILFQSLPSDLLDRYFSVVLQMKTSELEFLQKHAPDNKALISAKSATLKCVGLNPKIMSGLRESREIFLRTESHCSIFFSERLASILHTWGRVLLYYHIPITPDMRQKYMWFSKLSNSISRQCQKLTDVHILFEHLTGISLVPIMLKGLGQCSPEEKKSTLMEAHTSLTKMLDNNKNAVTFYEHGHIKEVEGAVYTQMILHRFLIRVNTKLLALPNFAQSEDFVANSDRVYDDLHNLASEHITWIMAPKCLVYCGKYQACKGNYNLAVKCFCEAIQAGMKQSSNLFAWACYNFARAVVCGNVVSCKESALEKCKEALKSEDDTDRDLVEKLTLHKTKLSEM